MKKIIFAISFLFIALGAFATEVPSSTAFGAAKKFMDTDDLSLLWDGNDASESSVAPAFFIFNVKGGGWVIISGEDSTIPILAYSDTGTFKVEGMPSNLRSWMSAMRRGILKMRSDGVAASESVRKAWADPSRPKTRAAGDKILETANWDQGSPYNNLLSTYVKRNGSGISGLYTGCVATAMAITLKYHNYPEHGIGSLTSYTTGSYGYSVSGGSIEDHYYDWDNMLMSYGWNGSGASSDQKKAVAQLMADCGIMVQMDYSTQGSGALSEDIIPALTAHMGYSKAAVLRYRDAYTAQDWMEMIINDIDNCGPILYSGVDAGSSGQDAGHQFVCDGYNADKSKIHINWGWSGSSNGYFTLTLAMGEYTFSSDQSAIFGLVPDPEGTASESDPELVMRAYGSGTGIKLTSGTLEKGKTFTISAGAFINFNTSSHTWSLKAMLVDKDGNLKEELSNATNITLSSYGYRNISSLSCSVKKSNLALGDKVAIWFKRSDGSWAPVQHYRDLAYVWEWCYVDACFIRNEGNYTAGEQFYFTLIPGNQGISSVAWTYDGSSTSAASVKLTAGTHTVKATVTFSSGTVETISQTIVVK